MSKQKRKPGDPAPPGKFPVYDQLGRLRGHVGKRASAVTAGRIVGGKPGAKLGKRQGDDRDSWSFPK
jgi:hypothetical protein